MHGRVSFLVALIWASHAAILPPSSPAQTTNGHYRCAPLGDSTDERESGYPPIIIHDIKFDGDITLPNSDLDQFASHLKQEKWHANPESTLEIEEEAWGHWQDRGYFESQVSADPQVFSVDSAGEHVFLTFHVNEGPKCWLKEIKFRKGDISESSAFAIVKTHRKNTARQAATAAYLTFPPEQLRKLIPLHDGDVFEIHGIREGLDAMKKLYSSYGYIEFVATPITELDEQHRVLLTMELDEGKQFRIGKVETRGADPALDNAVKSALPSGEVFDNDHWTAALRSVSDFSPERAEMRTDESAGTVDLIFDFRACRLAEQSNQR